MREFRKIPCVIQRGGTSKGIYLHEKDLPEDPDHEAAVLRGQIQSMTGKKLAVILADTEMIPFGTMDFAIGSDGIEPRATNFGATDASGKPKFGGMDLVAVVATEFGLKGTTRLFLCRQALADAGTDNAILQPAKGSFDFAFRLRGERIAHIDSQ